MNSARLRIHYGYHPGTTGEHFGAAAVGLDVGEDVPHARREHFSLRDTVGPSLWVESGFSSYPLDTWETSSVTAGYLIDAHQHLEVSKLQAALFDVVFVAQLDFVPVLRRTHPQVYWLPLAAPSWFLGIERHPIFDVGFVGALAGRSEREAVLASLNREFAMNDWRRPHDVREMARVYAQSRCVVNPPIAQDVNMRFFEAMAAGAATLTPHLPNGLDQLGTPGEHYILLDLRNPGSVVETVRETLRTGRDRSVGDAARELVRLQHTYEHRLNWALGVIADAGRNAPVRFMSTLERAELLMKLASAARDVSLAFAAARRAPRPSRALLIDAFGATGRAARTRLNESRVARSELE